MSVHFEFDWVDTGPSPDIAAHHTMAALTIKAGNETVTSVLDRRSKSSRSHVVVPLLHVAEWLACNWWNIWYEIANLNAQKQGFESRHNLSHAGDGFILPNLTMVPVSDRISLRWKPWKPQHTRIEFLDGGEKMVERKDLEEEFRAIIDGVLERLSSLPQAKVISESLKNDWDLINSVDADEIEFCRAASLLGLDPFDVHAPFDDAIVESWRRLDSALREDALACASQESLLSVSSWIENNLLKLSESESRSEWNDIRHAIPDTTAREPWRQGYHLARSARSIIGFGNGRFDFEESGPLTFDHHVSKAPSSRIYGLLLNDRPACVTIPKGKPRQRFLLARALGDFLWKSTEDAGILSSLATDRQARNRAFAAEFLAPSESLREKIQDLDFDYDTIDELSSEFGVSSLVVSNQIKNHELLSEGRIPMTLA